MIFKGLKNPGFRAWARCRTLQIWVVCRRNLLFGRQTSMQLDKRNDTTNVLRICMNDKTNPRQTTECRWSLEFELSPDYLNFHFKFVKKNFI
jgi:hypothetical protein